MTNHISSQLVSLRAAVMSHLRQALCFHTDHLHHVYDNIYAYWEQRANLHTQAILVVLVTSISGLFPAKNMCYCRCSFVSHSNFICSNLTDFLSSSNFSCTANLKCWVPKETLRHSNTNEERNCIWHKCGFEIAVSIIFWQRSRVFTFCRKKNKLNYSKGRHKLLNEK